MQAQQCFDCGGPADPPFIFVRFEFPAPPGDELDPAGELVERELVLCRDCNARYLKEVQTAQEQIHGRAWQCVLCCDDLDRPGGYAVPTFDGRGVLRLCAHCREDFERHRQPIA